jgi:hypothetical protein
MTYPYGGGDMLAGLDADPWEREQLAEVLDEVEAEGYGDDGPWHDAAFSSIGAALDDRNTSEAQRLVADITDQLERRPRAEHVLARALDRIADGTYTEPAWSRPARDAHGQFSAICGDADGMGRCAARYHAAGCSAVTASAAASGSYDDVQAWNEAVRGHVSGADVTAARQVTGLAAPSEPGYDYGYDAFGDLLEPPAGAVSYPELHAEVRRQLGMGEPPPRRIPASDTAWLREVLGL